MLHGCFESVWCVYFKIITYYTGPNLSGFSLLNVFIKCSIRWGIVTPNTHLFLQQSYIPHLLSSMHVTAPRTDQYPTSILHINSYSTLWWPLSDAWLVWNVYSHGLLTDQDQYFNGILNHVYWLRFSVKLAATAWRGLVCTGLNVKLFLQPYTKFVELNACLTQRKTRRNAHMHYSIQAGVSHRWRRSCISRHSDHDMDIFSVNTKDEIYSSSQLIPNLVSGAFRNPDRVMSGIWSYILLIWYTALCQLGVYKITKFLGMQLEDADAL